MTTTNQRGIALILFIASALSGCGGGGTDQPPTPTPTPTDLSNGDSGALSPPALVRSTQIDSDTLTAMSMLTTTSHAIVESPRVELELSGADSGLSSIKLNSGIISYGFSSPMDMRASTAIPFSSLAQFEIESVSVKQYKTSARLSGAGADHGFGASLQVPYQSGFRYAGMGNWKYLGGMQGGYFSGQQIAIGSFLFGEKTPLSGLGSIRSGAYSGFMQAAAEVQRSTAYFPYQLNYDQVSMSAVVNVDVASRTISIQFSNYKYWDNHYYTDELSAGFMTRTYPAGSTPPLTISCTGTIDLAANTYTCDPVGSWVSQGKITGRFFGPHGEEVAGTFALKGTFSSSSDDGVAGGFIARRSN